MSDFWVFGYGSLMWRPGFPFVESRPARLAGGHRSLCVLSFVHRGTRDKPGLVLGLDQGGTCRGVAFRVSAADAAATRAYLQARELVTQVYREVERPVRLDAGETVAALAYVVDRRHEQYAGRLEPEAMLARVRDAAGLSGANRDYVLSTARHLAAAGIHDPLLAWLAERLGGDGVTMP